MIGGKIISSTVQTLIETDYLSRSTFLFDKELSHDIPGISVQPQYHEGSDGSQHNSPLRFLNAVKLSLMLTRAYCRCYNDLTNNEVLPLLRLEDFVVKLQCSPNADEEAGETSRKGEEHLLSISYAGQLNLTSPANILHSSNYFFRLLRTGCPRPDSTPDDATIGLSSNRGI